MSAPEPSPNANSYPKRPTTSGGVLPAIGGGLLALGLLLTIAPDALHSATNLSSPVWSILQTVGTAALIVAAITFAIVVLRSVAHIGRRTAVR